MRKFIVLVAILAVTAIFAFAQAAPVITNTAEYSISFDCPSAQALSPDGETLWVLLQGCFKSGSALRAFRVADGEPLNAEDAFADELSVLTPDTYVDYYTNPLAFLPDGRISLIYSDAETYAPRRLLIDVGLVTGASSPALMDDDTFSALLSSYSDYPEATIYNADHSLAVAFGATQMTVLDLTTGAELFSLPADIELFDAFPAFAADNSMLYVARLIEPDDYSNFTSTLTTYSLPDGTPTGTSVTVASPFLSISPDGRYAAGQIGSADGEYAALTITDLTNGSFGEDFPLYEPKRKALKCVNDGRDLSDVDFSVSGKLNLSGINWLPDSSGFLITRSYGGEGVGGGAPCALNTSRLNRLDVSPGN